MLFTYLQHIYHTCLSYLYLPLIVKDETWLFNISIVFSKSWLLNVPTDGKRAFTISKKE